MTLVSNRNDSITSTDVRVTGGSRGNTDQVTIQSDATQIVGQNTERYAILVENIGSVTVEIGFTDALTLGRGHPLLAGAVRGFETTGALYGIVAFQPGLLAYTEEVA